MLLVKIFIASLTLLASSMSDATTRRIFFSHPYDQTQLARIGVLSAGVPLTSAVPVLQPSGVWYVDTHVIFGFETTLVAIDFQGSVSSPSNIIIRGGCDWDRDGDKTVGLADFGSYREEYGDGTAELVEQPSFNAAFGLSCDQPQS